MEWPLAPTSEPAQEPLTLDEARQHCAITQVDDNALVLAYLTAARQAAETALQRGLFTQTRVVQCSNFAETVWLPYAAPLQSVTSIQYYDANDVSQTLDSSYYVVETQGEPGCVSRAPAMAWPSLSAERRMPVTITYVCGWTDPALIPESIKQGIRYYVAALDADRTGAGDGEAGRKAAEQVWMTAGPVYWREPETCRV